MRAIPTVLAKGALLLASLGVALAVGEWWVRRTHSAPEVFAVPYRIFRLSKNETLRYEHMPNATYRLYTINATGQRDRQYSRRKPEGTHRIAVVGDSIAFGWDMPDGASWPDQLEELLGRAGPAGLVYEVINFAVAGYNSAQIAELAASEVAQWSPDLIVYGYCLNDPQEYSIEFEALLQQLSRQDRDWMQSRAQGALARLRVFHLIKWRVREIMRRNSEPEAREKTWRDDPQFQFINRGEGAQYYRALHTNSTGRAALTTALKRMSTVAPVVVAIFPIFEGVEPYGLSDVHEIVRKTAEAAGCATVDLSDAFSLAKQAGTTVMIDSLHPSREGHALAAVRIRDHLLAQHEE